MRPRTKNRLRALQVAYSSLLSDKDFDNALTEYFDARGIEPSAGRFAGDLLSKMNENLEQVDQILASRLDNWSPERLAILDRLMMRLAVTEFLFFDEIPPKVTINEYLQLAHWFGTEDSPRFINGVLDAVLKGLPAKTDKTD